MLTFFELCFKSVSEFHLVYVSFELVFYINLSITVVFTILSDNFTNFVQIT